MDQYTIKQRLPKVELHAHLNGSIPLGVLQELADERGVELSTKFVSSIRHSAAPRPPRTLQDCFDLFAELPAVINDLAALRRITHAALELFAAHHVAYLELRSTPKSLLHDFRSPGRLASKRDYLETVIQEIKDFEQAEEERCRENSSQGRLPVVCRLIVAVDRSRSLEEATNNIELAIQLHASDNSYVVGVDLGGNPLQQSFRIFEPLFTRARDAGLGVTIHCAEIPDCAAEVRDILEFRPDRLGHAVLLPDPHSIDALRIPVESCPTSNVMTLEMVGKDDAATSDDNTVLALRRHHSMLRHWIETDYPIVICTDDAGVFDTDPTQELWLVQEAFPTYDIVDMTRKSIEYAFCNATTKAKLRSRMLPRLAGLQTT